MAEFPGFTLWTDAYLGDTGHLTTLEHGAYLLLLIAMWRAGGSLPNDDTKLAKYCHLTVGQWTRIKITIMDFMTIVDGRVTQSRLTDELSFVRRRSVRQSENARAKSRKIKVSMPAMAEPNASQTRAPTLTPTLTEDTSLRSVEPASPKRPKPYRLFLGWCLPEEARNWALEKGLPSERMGIEVEKMINWSINSKNGAKLDWFAAWRNWVQRALDEHPIRAAPTMAAPLRGLAAIEERLRRDIENEQRIDTHPRSSDRETDAGLPFLAIADHGGHH